jgi:hypothetical protein
MLPRRGKQETKGNQYVNKRCFWKLKLRLTFNPWKRAKIHFQGIKETKTNNLQWFNELLFDQNNPIAFNRFGIESHDRRRIINQDKLMAVNLSKDINDCSGIEWGLSRESIVSHE